MTKVGVFGASGRMGATVCEMVVGDPDLELVAAINSGAIVEVTASHLKGC